MAKKKKRSKFDQPRPRICRIHVSQPAIRSNLKKARAGVPADQPVITVKRGDTNTYGHEVVIYDKDGNEVAVVTQPLDKKLGCGARVWIETKNPVTVRERQGSKTISSDLMR